MVSTHTKQKRTWLNPLKPPQSPLYRLEVIKESVEFYPAVFRVDLRGTAVLVLGPSWTSNWHRLLSHRPTSSIIYRPQCPPPYHHSEFQAASAPLDLPPPPRRSLHAVLGRVKSYILWPPNHTLSPQWGQEGDPAESQQVSGAPVFFTLYRPHCWQSKVLSKLLPWSEWMQAGTP